MLNASNTFTGTTTISGGVLRLGNAAALNTGSVSISGGTLDLNGFTPSNHLISISGTLANNGAEVDLGSVNPGTSVLNGLPNGGNPLTVTGSGDITLGTVTGTSGLSLTKNGSNNLTMAGNSDNAFMSMTVNSGTLILNKSTTGHVANEITIDGGVVRYGANTVSLLNGTGQINTTTVHSGILDLNGASGDNATIGNLTGSGGIITNSSGAPAILTIGGNNGTGGNYQGVIEDRSGQLALTKIGTGTITLSGVNTYTGDTTVTEGVLILKSACLSDRSFVSVVSGASLDLDFTGSDIVTGLTLGGVAQANGVYDASNSGGHLTGTGRIQVGANLNFATWAAANGIIGQSAMGDFDHDGLSNIMEYALGLDPASASTTPGILSGGVLVFTKGPEAVSNGDVVWQIERSTTLTDWEVVTPDADNPVTISYSLPIGQSKRFARLRITRIP